MLYIVTDLKKKNNLHTYIYSDRATSTESEEPDPLAIEAFCVVLRKEQDGAYIASRLIASRMHSDNPKIALLTLQVRMIFINSDN